jgi:hypothetical protein
MSCHAVTGGSPPTSTHPARSSHCFSPPAGCPRHCVRRPGKQPPGLLTVTGMRVSEACRLDRTDVNLRHGVLTVRDSKFGKSRDIPIHPSTTAAWAGYALVRDRLRPKPVGARRPSCPPAAPAWTRPTCPTPSPGCLPPPGSPRPRAVAGNGSMTCGTHSRWPPCSTGTTPASTSRPGCRCWPPTSAISTRSRRTGTSAGRPNCWPWPPHGWSTPSPPAARPSHARALRVQRPGATAGRTWTSGRWSKH